MIYTGSSNVPYVQFVLVSDFIPEPRCLKFAVGLQMRRRKKGCTGGPVRRAGSDGSCAMSKCSSVCLESKPDGSVVVS